MRTSFAEAPVRAFADQISTVELGAVERKQYLLVHRPPFLRLLAV